MMEQHGSRDRPGTNSQDHDDAYWADFGRTFGIGFAAGLAYAQQMAQHQATQEAAAERRIGEDRHAVQVVVGEVVDVDTELKQVQVKTSLGVTTWGYYGDMITSGALTRMKQNRQRVRLTVPAGKQGSHQAFFSGEMVDPDNSTSGA